MKMKTTILLNIMKIRKFITKTLLVCGMGLLINWGLILSASGQSDTNWLANNNFEWDTNGTAPPNITAWRLDFYTMSDAGVRGTGPNVVHQLNISTARSYSGGKSVCSYIRNIGGNGGWDSNTRHATHDLINTGHLSAASDSVYLWRSDVAYTTSSRYYWRLDVELSDGASTNSSGLVGIAWGNSEGVPGNAMNTSDLQATGSDGQTWYRHRIPIPTYMNHSNLTIKVRHQQDSWDGTSAESRLYVDLISAAASVALGDLNQTYDGRVKRISVTTTPPGLAVNVTYNGSLSAPTNAGSYTVIGTISDVNFVGSATNTLIVGLPPQGLAVRLTNYRQLGLTLHGSPNFRYVLLSATDLAPPISWQPVVTNLADANGDWSVTISNIESTASTFYRAGGE
jgi:hypothetical protein